jgi:molybdate-binding protein
MAPPIVAGSHDPLLEWALAQSGCELALLAGGSGDGLRRLAAGQCVVAGLHLFDPGTGIYNVHAIEGLAGLADIVLIEWGWRVQGLVVGPGNPLGLRSIADIADRSVRVARRQDGAGAQLLLRHLLERAGLDESRLGRSGPVALSETELAASVLDGKADCGLAVEAVARRFRLGFVPLHRERFDLALRRRAYFEPPFQRLLAFTASAAFAELSAALGGYDTTGIGRVVYNA